MPIEMRTELSAADRATSAYELLFRRSPRPSYVFDRSTLAFLDVNDAALELYGYDRDAFLRSTALDIRPPDEVPRLLAALGRGTRSPRRP